MRGDELGAVDSEACDFVRLTPKAEIHLHLEGSVDLETLIRVIARQGRRIGPTERRALARLYEHRDFPDFLRNFRALCAELQRPEDFEIITEALCDRLRRDGVIYAEVMCSPMIFAPSGVPAREILDAVSGAARRQRSREGGPRLSFILDGVRQWGIEAMEEMVREADACRGYDVIGIGMGGDESSRPTSAFASVYGEAKRRGLRTVVHVGEFDGPRSVWEAIDILEVDRIGHGVRSVEDSRLVEQLARRRIPLECCPTSNLRTGVVSSWESHPIGALHRAGAAVTINSDDPALFGTSIAREWEVLIARLGLSVQEVLRIGLRTAEATFLPDVERAGLVRSIADGAARAGVTA
jgi:adenosine deaminase